MSVCLNFEALCKNSLFVMCLMQPSRSSSGHGGKSRASLKALESDTVGSAALKSTTLWDKVCHTFVCNEMLLKMCNVYIHMLISSIFIFPSIIYLSVICKISVINLCHPRIWLSKITAM